MGRAGYAGKKDIWFEDEMTKLKEKNPDIDPVAVEKMVNECLTDQCFTWMKGHTPSSSQPPALTQEFLDAIIHWRELKAKEEFVPTGFDDVLAKATGTKEQTGRTKGVGGFVTRRKILWCRNFVEGMYP